MTPEQMQKKLDNAFDAAECWHSQKKCHDELWGFGKGPSWGAHILKEFMPVWVRRFVEEQNWSPICVLNGKKGFVFFAESCGLTEEQLWRFLQMFANYHEPKAP